MEQKWTGIVRQYESSADFADNFLKEGFYLTDSPAQLELEAEISKWRGSEASAVTNCGMAAIGAVLDFFLPPGTTALVSRYVFPGTENLAASLKEKGIKVIGVDPSNPEEIAEAVKTFKPVLFFTETIGNSFRMPVLYWKEIVDIMRVSGTALVVDTTFTPNFKPFEHDIECVNFVEVASMSKWETEHDAVSAGRISADADMIEVIKSNPHYRQVVAQPVVCEKIQIVRNTSNFGIFSRSAIKAAKLLVDSSKVKEVYYPGLTSHPHFWQAKGLFGENFGGVFYVVLEGGEEAAARFADLCNRGHWFSIATSFGGEDWKVLPFIGEKLGQHAPMPGLVRISSGYQSEGVDLLKKVIDEL